MTRLNRVTAYCDICPACGQLNNSGWEENCHWCGTPKDDTWEMVEVDLKTEAIIRTSPREAKGTCTLSGFRFPP